MFFSTFEIFKVGIGPSSSHTIGPMVAAARFVEQLHQSETRPSGVRVSLHGSLAFTGKGHSTDRAVILGLAGFEPATFDARLAETALEEINRNRTVRPPGLPVMRFDPDRDLVFDYERQLPGHSNGMILFAVDEQGDIALRETYYSIGGGTVVTESELHASYDRESGPAVPYPFGSAAELVELAGRHPGGIPGVMRDNEKALDPACQIDSGISELWEVMNDSIERGLAAEGILPEDWGSSGAPARSWRNWKRNPGRTSRLRTLSMTGFRYMQWRSTRKTPVPEGS